MVNSKAVILLIVASVLIAAVAGIAFAQFAGAVAASNSTSQFPQSGRGTAYPPQGYYQYGSGQSGYPNSHGMGMGMCGYR